MNKRITNRLVYDWWKYFAIAALIIVVWIFSVNAITRAAANEKIGITFVGTDFDDLQLEEDLNAALPNMTKQKLKEIRCESVHGETSYQTQTVVNTRLLGGTDLFIFTENNLSGIAEIFEEIDKDKYKNLFGAIEFYELNGKAYGICLTATKFFEYYSGKEKCYLFVSSKSVNIGGINGIGNRQDDAAIYAVKYILGY